MNDTKSPININTYFATLRAFTNRCKHDPNLTPAAQLTFRVLVEHANSSLWTDPFTCSIDELIAITHLARQTIVDARRALKNRGLIDFRGNPSKYTVYSLPDCKPDCSASPTPPVLIPKYNTKERTKQERKEESRHEANSHHSTIHSRNHQLDGAADTKPSRSDAELKTLRAELERQLTKLGC